MAFQWSNGPGGLLIIASVGRLIKFAQPVSFRLQKVLNEVMLGGWASESLVWHSSNVTERSCGERSFAKSKIMQQLTFSIKKYCAYDADFVIAFIFNLKLFSVNMVIVPWKQNYPVRCDFFVPRVTVPSPLCLSLSLCISLSVSSDQGYIVCKTCPYNAKNNIYFEFCFVSNGALCGMISANSSF